MRKTQETKLSEIFTLYLAAAAARGKNLRRSRLTNTLQRNFKEIGPESIQANNICRFLRYYGPEDIAVGWKIKEIADKV